MPSTSFTNVTNGIANDSIVNAPPSRPTRSANSVSSGVISTAAMTRVRHEEAHRVEAHRRQRVDLLVDAHRADLGGERGAGAAGEQDRGHQRPSSRSIARPIRSATKISAPNASSAPPTGTRGSRRAGTRSARRSAAHRRRPARRSANVAPADRRRMANRRSRAPRSPRPGTRSASRMSRSTPLGVAPDLLDRGPARRLRIEIVIEQLRIELPQQRGERGLQVGDLDRRGPRLAQQVDEAARCRRRRNSRRPRHRRRRVARPRRAARLQRVAPDVGNGVGVEPPGQRQHAAPIGNVSDSRAPRASIAARYGLTSSRLLPDTRT